LNLTICNKTNNIIELVEEIPWGLNLELKLFDEVVPNTENSKKLSKALTHVFENSFGV